MKKITLIAATVFSSLLYTSANAQISLNVNIGSQPAWGPVGYDYVENYYLPDIDTYYDVPNHQYVYLDNNVWVRSRRLPVRYANYNINNNYKVVVNEPRPWLRADVYRTKYVTYKGRHDQVIIRNSPDVKYKAHWKPGKGPKGPKPGHGPRPGGPHPGPGGPGHGPGKGHGKH
ncbi:hypothetical protein ACFQZS_11115 [Mucilaginibacter calamicampi]|uniref:Uncharacterized protein n=1 Tax=Mucilaginibacter calamicampi TaxID=1302352 RepID=A0ABW2YX58_9SPHI